MRFKLLFIPLGLLLLIHAQANEAYAQAGKAAIPGGATDAGVKKSTGPAVKADMASVRFEENPARVRFNDKSGKQIKEIAITVWDRKIFPGTEKDRTTGKPLSTFRQIEESVEISRDGGYAFINTVKREGIFEYMEGHKAKSEWKIYDRAGHLLWERKTDDVALGATFADSGVLATVIGGGMGGENDALRVYDKSGALVFLYPDGETDVRTVDYGMLKISRNGRYLATRVTFEDWTPVTLFFDLKTKKSWRAPHSYHIFEMTDDGSVWFDYYDIKKGERGPVSRINLKTYLGE